MVEVVGVVVVVFGVVDSSVVRGVDSLVVEVVGVVVVVFGVVDSSLVRGVDSSVVEVAGVVVVAFGVEDSSVVRVVDGSVTEVVGLEVVVSFAFTVTLNFVSCVEPSRKEITMGTVNSKLRAEPGASMVTAPSLSVLTFTPLTLWFSGPLTVAPVGKDSVGLNTWFSPALMVTSS